jgi:hypothetical protein
MYVGSFLSLVASGNEFKANQLQIEHDLLATHLLACWLTINHLINLMLLCVFALLSKLYFVHVDMTNIYMYIYIYIYIKLLVFYLVFSLYS